MGLGGRLENLLGALLREALSPDLAVLDEKLYPSLARLVQEVDTILLASDDPKIKTVLKELKDILDTIFSTIIDLRFSKIRSANDSGADYLKSALIEEELVARSMLVLSSYISALRECVARGNALTIRMLQNIIARIDDGVFVFLLKGREENKNLETADVVALPLSETKTLILNNRVDNLLVTR